MQPLPGRLRRPWLFSLLLHFVTSLGIQVTNCSILSALICHHGQEYITSESYFQLLAMAHHLPSVDSSVSVRLRIVSGTHSVLKTFDVSVVDKTAIYATMRQND